MNHRVHRSRNRVVGLLATAVGLLIASPAQAGSWQNSFAFGATLQGDLYTPTKLASPPAILVVIHMCSGHSSTVHGWFDSAADTNGFYLIAPSSGSNDCFDSSASRSGDRAAIVTMVNYLIANKGAHKPRVFATGMSSGGCMTNTLLAIYPDVFAGGSAMPGFPAGTWPAGDTVCMKCGSTPPTMSAAQWGALATNVFQWSGQRPCSQQWVGGGDQYNFDGYLPDVVLQFQNLSSLGSGMAGTGSLSGWTRTVYKDSSGNVRLETNLGPTTQMHDLENLGAPLYADVITFLGLDKATGACGLTTSSTGSGTGGATGTGGTTGSGGAGGKGGVTGSGGAAGGKGGATGTGGATGGAAGGAGGKGGATGSGGETGSGGAAGGKGGTTGTGGETGSGGATGSGGTTGTGGATGSGGATGTGGANTGAGGSATGGASGEGGSSQTGGTTGGTDSSAGCSCALDHGASHGGSLAILLGVALALSGRRRGRARR